MKIITQIILIVMLIFSFGSGYFFLKSQSTKTGVIKMRIIKNEWKFEPDTIQISVGKPVELVIFNEDAFEHSFYIGELNINQILSPQKETIIKITPNKKGTFAFYCSLVCGAGHYRMNGKLTVN